MVLLVQMRMIEEVSQLSTTIFNVCELYLQKYNLMAEVFREFGFVFFFYSNEGQEPIHIHTRKAGGFAKFWIEPVELEYAQGMKIADLKLAEQLIVEYIDLIKIKWNEVHSC